MTPNTSVLTIVCIFPLSSGPSSSSTLLRDTTISCALGALKLPYTAHWTPPPFCRVRLYRNMVSYFVARATRRTLNRLRLSRADLRRAPRYDQPLGIGAQTITPRGFCRRQFFQLRSSQLRPSQRARVGKLSARRRNSRVESHLPTLAAAHGRRAPGFGLPSRIAMLPRIASVVSRGLARAPGCVRGGASAMDRPRDRVSGIRVGGRLARRGDCWNGRVGKRVRDRLRGITGTVR